ncbi:MFS transporter permease [Vibrio variabilis]|uniref:MFS transporter permease n=1 Tax=Vibrio variabilis TaxID=990271 RepID=A0ABR4YF15_9VIBR|nr:MULTISPECIES: DUF2798 domain-containing protein [Vibrio]KHA62068.1 MFS transporter permease [Vibrio variabilis]CAK4074795.1 hypothetical protein VDT1_3610 [Vibrio sp. 16]
MNRKQFWLSALLSSFTMAAIMSGLLSGYKLGFGDQWPAIWMQSFALAWPCALLLNLTVLPQVRKLATWLATATSTTQV